MSTSTSFSRARISASLTVSHTRRGAVRRNSIALSITRVPSSGNHDNDICNVHHANTVQVNALKENKWFDYMVLPGKPHGYGDMQPHFTKLLMEYYAENLLGDYSWADANFKQGRATELQGAASLPKLPIFAQTACRAVP